MNRMDPGERQTNRLLDESRVGRAFLRSTEGDLDSSGNVVELRLDFEHASERVELCFDSVGRRPEQQESFPESDNERLVFLNSYVAVSL